MKGTKSITLNGEQVPIRLTMGAVEDFQEYLESLTDDNSEVDIDKAMGNMKHARQFLSIMSRYGDNPKDAENFKYMDFSEMQHVTTLVNDAVGMAKESKPGGSDKKK